MSAFQVSKSFCASNEHLKVAASEGSIPHGRLVPATSVHLQKKYFLGVLVYAYELYMFHSPLWCSFPPMLSIDWNNLFLAEKVPVAASNGSQEPCKLLRVCETESAGLLGAAPAYGAQGHHGSAKGFNWGFNGCVGTPHQFALECSNSPQALLWQNLPVPQLSL